MSSGEVTDTVQLPVAAWVHPDEFAAHRQHALALGFAHCEAGPLVRSSYHAHEHVKPAAVPAAPPFAPLPANG